MAFFFAPESPNYLLLNGRVREATNAVTRLYGKNNFIDVRVAHLQASINREREKNNSLYPTYLDCFKGTDRKRTLTVCLLMLGNGLIGSAFLTQNIYFLGLVGLPAVRSFDINIGGFGLALLIIPLSWLFGDKIGHRPLYLVGAAGNAIGMAVVGGLGYAPEIDRPSVWAIGVILNLLITWQVFTSFMVSWSMAPELSSYTLRQPTQSIGICVQAFSSWFFAFVTPYMYNVAPDAGNLGAKTGFIFMGTSIILFVWAWFWVPETKGLSTEELDLLYERGVEPRFFAREIDRLRKGAEEQREAERRRDDVELKEFEAGGGDRHSFGEGRDEFGL
ncbi:putative maltose permease MAL61 [Amylocarpus encephaloides]|uniref:Maltose permease MAL61 n=1 Tax=Amylocarpus encephaloides TaxID=45428 RepID=A0A9P7YKY2_9HELO|nr:putative maltose permease MAL61 [Amylocarpus encephaloides]